MSRFPLFAAPLAVIALTACETENDHPVPEGSFVPYAVSDDSVAIEELDGLTLIIDRDAETITVRLADGSEQAADLLLRDRSEWEADCYTMNSHALTEVYDVDVEALSLGTVDVALPVLTAKCGGRPMLGSDGGDETFAGTVFNFEEAL